MLGKCSKNCNKEYKKYKFSYCWRRIFKKELQQKTKELKLDNNIQFVDHVMHQNVYDYYKKLSVFIAVSKRESFGVSVLEAASCEFQQLLLILVD